MLISVLAYKNMIGVEIPRNKRDASIFFFCLLRNFCVKFLKIWEYQNNWPASWEICMYVKKQQLELDKEQQTGSK